jgi:hypothetical protein
VAFGCPAGEDLGGEEAAKEAQPLLARRQEAEASERMADVGAAPAEGDQGDGGVGDLREQAARAGRGLVEQAGGGVGGPGEDDPAGLERAGGGVEAEAVFRAEDSLTGDAGAHVADLSGEPPGQLF